MQTEVVLSLGGNKGNREMLLGSAIEELKDFFQVESVSQIYETEAWGGVAKGKFLNQLVLISTEMNAEKVLQVIQQIETKLGRTREEPWGDRTMDIDILYFGDKVINLDRLKIPHAFIAERKFVLVPLVEILPNKFHPVAGKNSIEMLAECKDQSEVKVWVK